MLPVALRRTTVYFCSSIRTFHAREIDLTLNSNNVSDSLTLEMYQKCTVTSNLKRIDNRSGQLFGVTLTDTIIKLIKNVDEQKDCEDL